MQLGLQSASSAPSKPRLYAAAPANFYFPSATCTGGRRVYPTARSRGLLSPDFFKESWKTERICLWDPGGSNRQLLQAEEEEAKNKKKKSLLMVKRELPGSAWLGSRSAGSSAGSAGAPQLPSVPRAWGKGGELCFAGGAGKAAQLILSPACLPPPAGSMGATVRVTQQVSPSSG